jgi:hypothetical protein
LIRTIADDDEIAEVSKNIKELNTDQSTLEEARDILMEKAGINIAVDAAAYIRGIRINLNKDLTEAKSRNLSALDFAWAINSFKSSRLPEDNLLNSSFFFTFVSPFFIVEF